jgi:hypothetical protein
VDASAKIRTGGPSDDRADLKNEELRAKTCELFECEMRKVLIWGLKRDWCCSDLYYVW